MFFMQVGKGEGMQLKVSHNGAKVILNISKLVKSFSDSLEIQSKIASLIEQNPASKIEINFLNAFVIPSALIGALQKFVLADKANIAVITHEQQLYELLENLHLTEQLHVSKPQESKI
jgi:hypothetical protein